MKLLSFGTLICLLNLLSNLILVNACSRPFEGFGVYLGRFWGLNNTELIKSVLKLVHDDLGIRLFRTEYPHQFSTEEDKIEIKCRDDVTCTWIDIHRTLAQNFKDVKVFASVWSPPKYMTLKLMFNVIGLKPSYYRAYFRYLREVTKMIDQQFGIKIEKVSVVNEPECPAEWDHYNIDPYTLAAIILAFGDDNNYLCPETSSFEVLKIYLKSRLLRWTCSTILTHSYGWHVDKYDEAKNVLLGQKFPNISYDLTRRNNVWGKPIWMTEVSSPGKTGGVKILEEAIDFAKSIIYYVGYTCVTRYYYWYAYMTAHSGEALIWSNFKVKIGDKVEKDSDRFVLPKKYFVYRHFSHSSMPLGKRTANLCLTDQPIECIKFDDNYVFVNSDPKKVFKAPNSMPLCCTTRNVDYGCNFNSQSIPPQSVCSSVDAK